MTTRTRPQWWPTPVGTSSPVACPGTAWRSCSAPTRSRRSSRPRSPGAAFRSGSREPNGSRRGPSCACSSTVYARPECRAPTRSFADHLADFAADSEAGAGANAPTEPAASPAAVEAPADADELQTHRDALLRFGRDYAAAEPGSASVAGFISWLDFATRAEAAEQRGVDLVTFHRAKGLEWQVVFVTGLERGLVPISWAGTPDARAEERRLLHVALGRAEDWVQCSWARERTAHGRRAARQPSPWLDEIEQAIALVPVAPVDRTRGSATRSQRWNTPRNRVPTSHARRVSR